MIEGLKLDSLPTINSDQKEDPSTAHLLIIPLNRDQRTSLEPVITDKDGGNKKERLRLSLVENGLTLGFNKDGSLSLLGITIPARELHKEIRNQGKDPNQLARWLAGRGYNLLSEAAENPSNFYAKLETDRFEVGFVTFPEDGKDDPLIAESNVHKHPDCREIYILTGGSITLWDKISEVERSDGVVRIDGKKIVLDFDHIAKEGLPDDFPGMKVYRDMEDHMVAVSYTVPRNSHHFLEEASPKTELILVKSRPSTIISGKDWRRAELHPDEKKGGLLLSG